MKIHVSRLEAVHTGSGWLIKGMLDREVNCAEFTTRDDVPQPIIQSLSPATFSVGCDMWMQFKPKEWTEMEGELFQQLVAAWNEKHIPLQVSVGTWFGKPIEDLDRNELLKIIKHLSDLCEELKVDRDLWKTTGDVTKYLIKKWEKTNDTPA